MYINIYIYVYMYYLPLRPPPDIRRVHALIASPGSGYAEAGRGILLYRYTYRYRYIDI